MLFKVCVPILTFSRNHVIITEIERLQSIIKSCSFNSDVQPVAKQDIRRVTTRHRSTGNRKLRGKSRDLTRLPQRYTCFISVKAA